MFDQLMERMRASYSPNIAENPTVIEAKKNGQLVFGMMCSNVPEELLAAADILPVRFLGSSSNVTSANEYQTTYMCHYARSILEMGLNEEYKSLDGQVYTYGCDGGSNLYQILMETVPQKYQRLIYIPHNRQAADAAGFYLKELQAFKESLEEYTGKKITDEAIREAIQTYNKHRDLLQQIYDLRGTGTTPLITGYEAAEIVEYTVSVSKKQSNEMLAQLIAAAKTRKVNEWKGPRIIVDGTFVNKDLQRIIEELDAMVVGDGICLGNRIFANRIDETIPPMEALVQYALNRLPCNCLGYDQVAERRLEHVLTQIKKYHGHGVVLATQKWCDPFEFDRPFIQSELQKLKIPVTIIDIERTADTSQIHNRLESFMEMIKLSSNYEDSMMKEVN